MGCQFFQAVSEHREVPQYKNRGAFLQLINIDNMRRREVEGRAGLNPELDIPVSSRSNLPF